MSVNNYMDSPEIEVYLRELRKVFTGSAKSDMRAEKADCVFLRGSNARGWCKALTRDNCQECSFYKKIQK